MTKIARLIMPFCLVPALFLLGGCAGMNFTSQDKAETPAAAIPQETPPESVPYVAGELRDILIPSELQWNRADSMYVKTDSFVGGILSFSGRVEVNSLTDFFVSTMAKNKWRLSGSVKYEKVLLAFVKADKTCLINIFDSKFSGKTEVYIYVTQNIPSRKDKSPFGEEILR